MKKFLVIGNPIDHSLSPILHNHWIKENNLKCLYEKRLLELNDLKSIISEIKSNKITGANVTVPFKRSIIPFVDVLTESAKKTNSVNTLYKLGEEVWGDNTDWIAFKKSLNEFNFDISGKKIFILGAGGVTSSIIYALENDTEKILVTNRTKSKTKELKEQFPSIEILDWGKLPTDFDIIINTTSVGLKKNEKIDLNLSNYKNKFFYDVIYSPPLTNFLLEAKKSDNQIKNGMEMFLYQAQASFKIWHGFLPIIDEKTLKLLNND